MLNLIKMDFYRMFHSLSAWVILAFAAGLGVFSVAMTAIDLQYMAEEPAAVSESSAEESSYEPEELQFGIYSDTDPKWAAGQIEAGSLLSTELRSGLLVLLCVIFTALFVNAEQKNGYIKNIAGQLSNRGILALSKLTAVAFQILMMMAVFAAAVFLSGMIFWGGRFYLASVAEMLPFLGRNTCSILDSRLWCCSLPF